VLTEEEGLDGQFRREFARFNAILQKKAHAKCMQEIDSGSANRLSRFTIEHNRDISR
jgi:hypothetical protein